jgi:hypothetical protein
MRRLGFALATVSLGLLVGCSSGSGDTEAIRPAPQVAGTTGEPPRPATGGSTGAQPFTGDAQISGEVSERAPR